MRVVFGCVLLLALALAAAGQNPGEASGDSNREDAKKANKRPEAPKQKPEPFDNADVKTLSSKCVLLATAAGDIRLEMFPAFAPNTVRNFLNLVAIKAFDNTTFSRVVPDFVIQGGDLYTNEDISIDMQWRAQRKLKDEPNRVLHERGVISMARGEEKDSASTSFFILMTSYKDLDGKFAAFGRVISGMDIVVKINKMPVKDEKPKEPVRIVKAVIEACPKPAEGDQ